MPPSFQSSSESRDTVKDSIDRSRSSASGHSSSQPDKVRHQIELHTVTDLKYAQFRQEINFLGDRLEQLKDIIVNANSQGSSQRRQDQTLKVLPEVTGDFHQTLKDCKTLIRKHAALQHSRPTIFANFDWWTRVEPEVNRLRERVKFHITKVSFIAKPFETQLLLDVRNDVQRLIRDVNRLTRIVVNGGQDPECIALPEQISARFDDAFHVNRPAAFQESDDWPLRDGFDALVFHLSRSTTGLSSRPELGQNIAEPAQYLNLLKCAWILKYLKMSSYFRSTGDDSLWADYMRRLEEEIKLEFFRFDEGHLIAPPHDVVLTLPESCFSIWIEVAPPPGPSRIIEQQINEEKILEVSLPETDPARESSLTVYRKSDVSFRLVTTNKSKDNPLSSYAEGFHIDMTSTRLIPSYATPNDDPEDHSSETNNLAFYNERDHEPTWLTLCNYQDLASVQQALLGYRIQHDTSDFSWCINGSKHDWGHGRLQLWQPKLLPRILPSTGEETAHSRNTSISTPQLPEMGFGDDDFLANLSELGLNHEETPRPSRRPSDVRSSVTSSGSQQPRTNSAAQSVPFSSPRSSAPSHPSRSPTSSMQEHMAAQYRSNNAPSRGSTHRAEAEHNSNRRSSSTLLTRSSVVSSVSGPRGNGTELIEPELPILIIFTIYKSRYTFLHVKLEPHIIISHPRKGGNRAVLERSNRSKAFIVRKFSASQSKDEGLFVSDWDLALFRLPQRQEFDRIAVVEKMKTLDLAFGSVEAKNTFVEELTELRNLWTVEQNEYNKEYWERKRKAGL